MYSIRNFFKQSPTAMSGAIGAALTQITLIGWSPLTDRQSLGVSGLVFLLLNLFYAAPLVSANAKLDVLQDHTLEAINLGIHTDDPPPPPKK